MGQSFVNVVIGFFVMMIVGNLARVWWIHRLGNHGRKIALIADGDSHLSFDERIAERLRELDREKNLSTPLDRSPVSSEPLSPREPAPMTAPRPTFGRRTS